MSKEINKKYDALHLAKIKAVQDKIRRRYLNVIEKVYQKATGINYKDGTFRISDYPVLANEIDKQLLSFSKDVDITIQNGIKDEWELSIKKNAEIIHKRYGEKNVSEAVNKILYDPQGPAFEAFKARQINGMALSDRVLKYTGQFRGQIEQNLFAGISEGKSAVAMARDQVKYMENPEPLFRRVRDAKGNLKLSKAAEKYYEGLGKPGQGVYRSPFKNFMRITRDTVNESYRQSDMIRYETIPFVLGYVVSLSNNHPVRDICDDLQGTYPKTFKWRKWHIQCYSDDTEVQTNNGWKYFKDLLTDDLIFSLNPVTKQPEYTSIDYFFKKHHTGDMIRFSNKSLDMLVTPDHPMKFLFIKKGKDGFGELPAEEFRNSQGSLYRSSEYKSKDIKTISIGEHKIDFDLFTEFMAYYLAEGSISLTRNKQFFISQCRIAHSYQFEKIKALLMKLPFKFTPVKLGFYMSDETMYNYLKRYGKSVNKQVPEEILNASPRQIQIFLDSYVICDGTTVKTQQEFIGSRGTVFKQKHPTRIFFSSSDQMASDLGEMLVKVGKRPSYNLQKTKGVAQKHRNGVYIGNKDLWRITECHSKTASTFYKTVEQYDGIVYDIQLSTNHIMYVRRNGKAVWGSNCMCSCAPELPSPAEYAKFEQAILNGTDKGYKFEGEVKELPNNLNSYVEKNKGKMDGWARKPDWVVENGIKV